MAGWNVRRAVGAALTAVGLAGCYSGAQAARDVSEAWVGRSEAELVDHWGPPAARAQADGYQVLRWTHTREGIVLPSVEVRDIVAARGRYGGTVLYRPGAVYTTATHATALVEPDGTVSGVGGASLEWGAPDDANLRWGFLLGMHVGMGRLDDTPTPLPSGGLYIGGMLARDLALVGTFAMVSGLADEGGAMGLAWGLAPQWWPTTRVAVRAGPAMVLDFDPGFEDARLSPGLATAASFALLRSGAFVLDLRLDTVVSPEAWFGSLGVGVNLN